MWSENLTVSAVTDGTIKNSKILKNGMIRVTWRIENFEFMRYKNGEVIVSPAFSTDPLCKSNWELSLYPNGVDRYFRNNISICLCMCTSPDSTQIRSVDVCFSLLDFNDMDDMQSFRNMEFHNGLNWCWCERFVDRQVLFRQRQAFFSLSGTLTVVCYLYNFEPVTNMLSKALNTAPEDEEEVKRESVASQKNTKFNCDPQIKFCQDMVALLKDAKMCDVTLRAEGRDLKAHKLVLAARSSVFCSMFEHPMKEKSVGVVEVADIEFECLESFVVYLYCGKMGKLTVESALGLLAASDKYAVEDLCEICTRYLKEHLDIVNSLQVLIVADLHSITGLKEAALAFTCQHFKEVSAKPDWKDELKERPHLAAELLFALTETKK